MKKAFISVLYFLLLAVIIMSASGCTSSVNTSTNNSFLNSKAFKLTDERINTLSELCACVPDFFDVKEIDTAYIRDFLFASYSTPEKDPAVVSKEDIEKRIQLIFGVEYDVSKLVYTDTYSYCYFEDGNVLVQPSSVDKLKYEFDSFTQNTDTYTAIFNMMMGDTLIGTRTISFKQADNENGFVVVGASRQNS